MRKFLSLIAIVVGVVVCGSLTFVVCGSLAFYGNNRQPLTATSQGTPRATRTIDPRPTRDPDATFTPYPTKTTRPTRTPIATSEPTATPEPTSILRPEDVLWAAVANEVEAVDIREIRMEDTTLWVEFSIDDNFSNDWIRDGARRDTRGVMEAIAAHAQYTGYGDTVIAGWFPLVDTLGNTQDAQVTAIRYSRETLESINWDGFLTDNAYVVAESARIHPAFQE